MLTVALPISEVFTYPQLLFLLQTELAPNSVGEKNWGLTREKILQCSNSICAPDT